MDTETQSVCAHDELIKDVLATLHQRIGPQKFNAWFRHGARLTFENGCVKLAVANPFVANWVEKHYQGEIAASIQARTDKSRRVLVTIDPSLAGELGKRQLDSQADLVTKTAQGRTRPRRPMQPPPLRHRLEDFVVGVSNKLAYSAAASFAGAERLTFDLLFVHGSCGVGKTHLLQGVCNAFYARRRGRTSPACRYVTGEQFTNEFLASLRDKKLPKFRARYRHLDLLAIDDVHFLAAKRATQDEFLHTYNAIEAAGKRVVMASDAHPHMVGDLNSQLVSRFVSGMVVRIDPPDRITRVEILRRRAEKMKLRVQDDVLEYIATQIRSSVRELEGTLVKLAAVSALENAEVTLQMAVEALADHLARTDRALTLGDIEAVVAAYFGITPADIHSSRRTRTVSAARMIAMFLARRRTPMSYPEIGRSMGKNHSSAVLAVKRMESLLASGGEISWMTPLGTRSMRAEKLLTMMAEQLP